MKLALAVGSLTVCASCAWDAGRGFATLSEASVAAELEIDGPLLSDDGEEITLQALEIDVSAVELEASPSSEGTEPEHEHEEPQAAEAVPDFEVVATLHVDQTLDWAAATPVIVGSVEPSRELPQTELVRAAVSLTAVRLNCALDNLELSVELPLELTLTGAMDFDVNRDAPERVVVDVSILQSASLFAGLDFASLGPGSTTLADPSDPLATALLENLRQSQVAVAVRKAP